MLGRLRSISQSVENEFLAPLDPDQRARLRELLQVLASYHDVRYAPTAAESK